MPRLLLVALFLTFLSLNSFAWDDVGHKITGYIAWQRMSDTAKGNVIRILRSAPEDSHLTSFYARSGVVSEEIRNQDFFMTAATWPDIVRDFGIDPKSRNETRFRKYHKSNWHYADTFWKQVNGKEERLSGFAEGGQAVNKLVEFEKLIRDALASDKDKAIAIAWIMHLVGDLHQPLHTSARVTDSEPKGDAGGNLFLLTPKGTPREQQLNLHWYWDSIVGRNVPPNGETCERDYLEPLAQKFMKKYPFADAQSKLNLGNYEALQQESFAFNPTDLFSSDLIRFQTPSEKYKKNAYRIAEKQLAMAGYRLGETFNSIFGAPPPAAQ